MTSKKSTSNLVLSILFCAVASLVLPQSALALTIEVLDSGRVSFYEDVVLGEEDSISQDKNSEKIEKYQAEMMEQKQNGTERREQLKEIRPNENKQIEMRTEGSEVKIELRNKDQSKAGFEKSEKLSVPRVELKAPAGLKEEQLKEIKQRMQKDSEQLKNESMERREEMMGKRAELSKEEQQKREEYINKLKEERAERKDELMEIKSRQEKGEAHLEFKSRDVTAKSKQGADFSFDPETNEVSVLTPSGEEHVLNHLPDQAITKMRAAGVLKESDFEEETEVEIETTEDGVVQYKTQGVDQKKILGLFPIDIEKEVLLDDATGEVTETEKPIQSPFAALLRRLAL